MFEKADKRLHELQAERKHREADEMIDAVRLLEMHEAEEERKQKEAEAQNLPKPAVTAYDPKLDGFVFSTPNIQLHIFRETRRKQAREFEDARPAAA